MKAIIIALGLLSLFTAFAFASDKPAKPEYKISGPYTHKNLTIFLFHGPDKLKGRKFLTLQEGLDQKVIVVNETSDVNELTIENKGDVDVYIQSGEIVKGGKQDRTIAFDVIIPPKSGKKPLDAFCVEHGRWQARGGERSDTFATAFYMVSDKDLKIATKGGATSQPAVWASVARQQDRLSENLGAEVRSSQSASSYQLTLENKNLEKLTDEYVKALANVVEGKDDVIGYAFAIDGKVNSVDIYASADLFRKLWPKLIKSSSVEAIAEGKKDAKFAEATVDDVKKCMADAEQGKLTEKTVSDRVKMRKTDAPAAVKFQTLDEQNGDSVHENYIKK